MGKRSDFERIPRDLYPTPAEAVAPLLPHLAPQRLFAEPCAGDGRLIRHLEDAGHSCVYASDIHPMADGIQQCDFRDVDQRAVSHADCIITNPPWDRKLLHPIIEHFGAIKPTWLLFDADWLHTKQAAPFMGKLVKIVSVGRVKWIEGSKMTGKDNCAWMLFDAQHSGPTEFYGRT